MEVGDALRNLNEAIDAFAAVDQSALAGRELLAESVELERCRRRLDAATAGVAGEVDRTGAFRIDGHLTATAAVKHVGRLAASEASGRVKAASVLRRLPLFAKSYAEGRIPTGHVAVLGRVGSNPRVVDCFDEADEWFRERACELDHEAFKLVVQQWEMLIDSDGAERQSEAEHARRNASVIKGFDGSFRTRANHGAVQGESIAQVLEAFERAEFEADWADARERHGDRATKSDLVRTSAQRRADAMFKIFRLAAASPDVPTGVPTVVNIVVDEATFETELARRAADEVADQPEHDPSRVDETVCRTTNGVGLTPGEVVMAAMAGLVRAIVVDATGNVINHGRMRRLFTGASREAILLREALKDPAGVRCGYAACDVPGWRCQIDHREPAARGGPTDHDNGNPLCGSHNRLKETGFHPRRAADGTWVIHRPDGTPITSPA